jgi:hypothetical protein
MGKGGSEVSLATRFRERQYRPVTVRIGLAAAVVAGVCLSQLSPSTSGADTSFVPGTANAAAQAISVAPTSGGLNYAITLATSISDYQNSQAQSLSQTIDLGAIGTSLEAEGCNNAPPTLPQKDVPPPIQAESIDGNQNLTKNIVGPDSSLGVGVGIEQASVTTQPTATSSTMTGNISVAGLLSIGGLTSTSHVALVNGNTRQATATSTVGSISLANGLIVLSGLQWTATQISGASTSSTGTFTLGSLKVAGTTVTLPSVAQITWLLTIINTALSPLGLNIQFPAQTTTSDGTVGITPLVIGIDNNALGQEIIGTNLIKVQPVREALVNAILNADCNLASEITVSDIGLGVLAGGGNLNLNLGGATAHTTDAASVSPFGSGTLPSALGNDNSTLSLPSSLPSSTFGLPGTAAIPPTTGTTAPTTGSGAPQKVSLGPTEKTTNCISLGPAGGSCTSTDAALPIGLIGLALVLGLATLDYLRQRRRARLSGQEMGT